MCCGSGSDSDTIAVFTDAYVSTSTYRVSLIFDDTFTKVWIMWVFSGSCSYGHGDIIIICTPITKRQRITAITDVFLCRLFAYRFVSTTKQKTSISHWLHADSGSKTQSQGYKIINSRTTLYAIKWSILVKCSFCWKCSYFSLACGLVLSNDKSNTGLNIFLFWTAQKVYNLQFGFHILVGRRT